MTTTKPSRDAATNAALSILSCLLAAGCMPAPGPPPPIANGLLEIGADYRDEALGGWVCDQTGSIVLARGGGGYVLHLENHDWVLAPIEGSATEQAFSYSGAVGARSLPQMRSDPLPSGVSVLVATTNPAAALQVRHGTAGATEEEACEKVTP